MQKKCLCVVHGNRVWPGMETAHIGSNLSKISDRHKLSLVKYAHLKSFYKDNVCVGVELCGVKHHKSGVYKSAGKHI